MADERWVIEPGPEAENAQQLGAAEVQRAQKLAKDKHYADAAAVLEQVARKWPAALHDCNLALAYLRAGAYTRAQLVWELSALRNTTRPKWCTGEVSTQLSTALRAAGFVPTTIDVVPLDAVVEVGGVAVRGMRTVWLPRGTQSITASAQGRTSQTVSVAVSAPTTRVTITLQEPAAEPLAASQSASAPPPPAEPVPPPGGASEPGVTTTPAEPPPTTAGGTTATPAGTGTSAAPGGGTTTLATPRYLALGAVVAGALGTGVFGYLTYAAHADANDHYASDPAFARAKDRHATFRALTIASLVVGAVGGGVYVYFTMDDRDRSAPSGAVIGYSGTFGTPR